MTNAREGAWCILRTSGGKTLALATSLADAGFEAWTPTARTWVAPTKRKQAGERAAPIVPTFVFVRGARLHDLARVHGQAAMGMMTPHPGFSIFQLGGRVPMIADRSLVDLREAEAVALRRYEAQLGARDREEARVARALLMKSEHARRKALRREVRDYSVGTSVMVEGAPSFAGASGIIERGDGRSYVVAFGSMRITIEAWQLMPIGVCDEAA